MILYGFDQGKEPIVYVRRSKRNEVVASPAQQQDISSKEICQKSSKNSRTKPNKLLENKEAKTIKKRRTKNYSNRSKLNTRGCKGGGAGNAKIISDNSKKEEKRKTWKPQTEQETNWNQLSLVRDENIHYVSSQLDFAKDLGEAPQRLAHERVCSLNKSFNDNTSRSIYDAKGKGKEVYQERNNSMAFADFYAQRGSKGITICEKSVNSRTEEMTKHLGASNNHSSGQKLQFQNSSVWPRHHKPRVIVHPSKIIGPSRFSQSYDQNMQRTSMSAPYNFSLMKLLMDEENSSTLTDEELLYAKELLSTHGLSLVQQWPCSQVGNYQNMERTSESATSNFSFMKLLMEDEDNFILTDQTDFLDTQYSLSSEGERVQQWPCSQFVNSLLQINLQHCQYQVLQQPQQIFCVDLLTREENILYMDPITREEDVIYVDLLTREEDISYMDLLTREDIP